MTQTQTALPTLTRDALLNWDTKTPYNSISPEQAWLAAVPVPWWLRDYFQDKHGRQPTEVRTYSQSAFTPSGPFQAIFVSYNHGMIHDILTLDDVKHEAAAAAFRELKTYYSHRPE